MTRTIPVFLLILLGTAITGCNGCDPSAAVEGEECEQTSDCAEGLWCLGRVCRQAPVNEANDGGGDSTLHDSGADGAQDAGLDVAIPDTGLDAELDYGVDGATDGSFDGANGDAQEIGPEDGGLDGGLVEGVWLDSSSGYTWQNPETMGFFIYDEAVDYCDGLSWAGYADWRVPTIDELRSLIRGCPDTESGGPCTVTDSCLEVPCYGDGCIGCSYLQGPGKGGCYWDAALDGPCWWYWSSSSVADGPSSAWLVYFIYGHVDTYDKIYPYYTRCVRGGS